MTQRRTRERRKRLPDDRSLGRLTDLRALPIVEVTWADSSSNHGWMKFAEARLEQLIECRTTGYLVRHDSRAVTVWQAVSAYGRGSEAWVIPRSCIRAIRRLK